MSRFIHKSHNVSVLLYHLVFVAKYRRVVIDEAVDASLRDVCLELALRYEVEFLEIGTDGDHVHFLIQSVPTYSATKIVTLLKSVLGRELFRRCPQIKKQLWGGEFWSDGYFVASVGQHESEDAVRSYVRNQGHERNYQQLHIYLWRYLDVKDEQVTNATTNSSTSNLWWLITVSNSQKLHSPSNTPLLAAGIPLFQHQSGWNRLRGNS